MGSDTYREHVLHSSFTCFVCAFYKQDRLLSLAATVADWVVPIKTPGVAAMGSREELEAEALSLFTGIGLAEQTAQ
jgi:hypothetical protein